MHLKLNFILLMGILAFFAGNSCSIKGDGPNNPDIVNMRINHYEQTGFGPFPQLVYLVQEGEDIGGQQWSYLYDEIQDFNYEPGFIYDLYVRKENIENPPQDASSIKYILESVSSKEKVAADVSFEIRLKWEGTNFVKISGPDFSLMDSYSIECGDLCEELLSKLENEEEVTGRFVHGDNNNELILISIH